MTTKSHSENRRLVARYPVNIVLVIALTLIGLSAAPAAAGVLETDGGEVPFYARVSDEPDFLMADGDLTMVYFYRPPECVPEAFNLLDFFDVPGAFSCGPPTTDGFSIWETGPFLDPAPYQVKLQGRGAVPVWFLNTEEYVAAISDGVLTIGDLEALNPLKATASQFNEVLHPLEMANVPKLIVQMKGHLDDGRPFLANSVGVGDGVNQNKFTVFPAMGPKGLTRTAPVPEPGALLLVSLGALSLLAFRRRR